MLSQTQQNLLDKNLYNYYHITGCNVQVFGEPFLESGYLLEINNISSSVPFDFLAISNKSLGIFINFFGLFRP